MVDLCDGGHLRWQGRFEGLCNDPPSANPKSISACCKKMLTARKKVSGKNHLSSPAVTMLFGLLGL